MVLFAIILYLFIKNRTSITLFVILILGLIGRLHLIQDPYLNTWDEKYHALVAKHLVKHPLKPTLYENPVLNFNPNHWTENHIWLSKPPLPLWMMATSIKILGPTTFAVRLPSLILSLLAVYLTFLLGKILFNKKTGLIAAFLYAINGLLIELSAGIVSSDHVENTFLILIQLSIYSIVYLNSHKKSSWWYCIPGIIIGLAFLSKWHISLIVFPIWGLTSLMNPHASFKILITQISVSILAFLIVISGWLIYIGISFPVESKLMLNNLIKPFSETIQNHGAEWYYYIQKIGVIFGELAYIPILAVIYFYYKNRASNHALLLCWVFIPLIIFSLAETKRFTYIMFSAPAIFMIISDFLVNSSEKIQWSKWVKVFGAIALIGLPIKYHFERAKYDSIYSKDVINFNLWHGNLAQFSKDRNPEKTVIFNTRLAIEIMFYSDFTAYIFQPGKIQLNQLHDLGFTCYDYDNGNFTLIKSLR